MAQLQRLTIAAQQRTAEQILLTDAQHHYLCRVLRLRQGDRFIAMDGAGHGWMTELGSSGQVARILAPVELSVELPVPIILLMGLVKQGMDEVIRQSTELGVTAIQPVQSDRALLKPSLQKLERWQRIAQEAAEQCERQVVPRVEPPLTLAESLTAWKASPGCGFICVARGSWPLLMEAIAPRPWSHSAGDANLASGQSACPPPGLVIAIGPEGGWTPEEIEQAIAQEFQPVSLGQRILRAATAPLAALAILGAVVEQQGSRPDIGCE